MNIKKKKNQYNAWTLTLSYHNSFQNQNNRKATYGYAPRPSIFKWKQKVLKLIDIYKSRGSPKI